MLEINDVEGSPLNEQSPPERYLEIPQRLKDFIERRGPLPPVHNDLRKHPRFYYPLAAIAEFHETLPCRPQEIGPFVVVVRDLSRSGLAFYHTDQVYPEEQLQISLPNGPKLMAVVRCHKRAVSCYEIAGTFV